MPEVRVLHVVGGMNVGGAETWLMHVLRNLTATGVHQDFLVHTTQPCVYDPEIRALGSRILPCMHPRSPGRYAWRLRRVLREGRYDVVHSHVHHFSGLVLKIAAWLGVPARIAHSHNDTAPLDQAAPLPRRAYLGLMRTWIEGHATAGLAASANAATALFGDRWQADPRWRTLYCGINLDLFRAPIDQAEVRAELGLPAEAFVIGHVGRFDVQKNHSFLIDIFAECARRHSQVWLLLVGSGPLRAEIERKAEKLGVRNRIVFAGLRKDVPRLLRGAMDVFLFPSLYEGLPLVLMEAQAAGLPCVISAPLPPETEAVPGLLARLPLSAPPAEWARQVFLSRLTRERIGAGTALARVEQSPFNIRVSVAALKGVYGAV